MLVAPVPLAMSEQVVPAALIGLLVPLPWLAPVELRADLVVVRCAFWPWDARDRARGFERRVGSRFAAL